MQIDFVFGLFILIVSVILHEVSHGYMANYLGDPTARLAGRLTLNPVSHIDPVGSILLPLLLVITNSPLLIGYAKPVPYNPYNLPGKYDEGLVAFAGPAVNIFLALLFGLAIRVFGAALPLPWVEAFATICLVNIVLALFNLLPVPPLDGSKVLSSVFAMVHPSLEQGYNTFRLNFERLGVLSGTLLILLLFFALSSFFFGSVVAPTFRLITGLA